MGQTETHPEDERLELRAASVDWLEVEDEIIALDVDRSIYLGTNASGAILWRALARGTTKRELVGILIQSFGLDEARAERDVDDFLQSLEKQELLKRS
jgi:hypothetical protein